jgi:hypothetical protein
MRPRKWKLLPPKSPTIAPKNLADGTSIYYRDIYFTSPTTTGGGFANRRLAGQNPGTFIRVLLPAGLPTLSPGSTVPFVFPRSTFVISIGAHPLLEDRATTIDPEHELFHQFSTSYPSVQSFLQSGIHCWG